MQQSFSLGIVATSCRIYKYLHLHKEEILNCVLLDFYK